MGWLADGGDRCEPRAGSSPWGVASAGVTATAWDGLGKNFFDGFRFGLSKGGFVADISNVKVNVNEAMTGITLSVRVKGARELRARIRVGIVFIKLAARIMGCVVEVATGIN